MAPRLYQRARDLRHRSAQRPGVSRAASSAPPVFLSYLFGDTIAPLSSAKARRVLGWIPRIELHEGQAISRAWLARLGLAEDQSEVASAADS
jgi:hypothetical protein